MGDFAGGLLLARELIPPGSTVLCAVSGGADSVCLLHQLYRLRREIPFTLAAAHYNHQLRGEEADRDAAFVRQFVALCCGRDRLLQPDGMWRELPPVELFIGEGDVASEARRRRCGVEETARLLTKEREDVEKLEKGGLRALLLSLTGDREVRLSQERREELAARLQYDQARRDAEDLEERIRDLLQEREELRAIRTQLEALLGEKAERLKELGGTGGTRLAELDRALDALAAQRREVGEALHAGRQAEQALSGVLDSLDSAESWGTWDMLGGGLFTTMAKHGHIDDARAGIDHAQRALSRFRTELADVRDMELPQVQIGEFATFADYFFDGFFMDWMVQSKIQDAQEGVSEVHVRVLNALRNLEQMDQELAGRQAGLESERKELLRTP